jgi:hypothetical protein
MEAFIETVSDPRLQDKLRDAIRGRGAFRRFKDVLAGHEAEQAKWYAFRDQRLLERVQEWLEDEGVDVAVEAN